MEDDRDRTAESCGEKDPTVPGFKNLEITKVTEMRSRQRKGQEMTVTLCP